MTDATSHPLEMILQQCSRAEPRAWYPSEHARAANIPRDSLDPYLDQLRLGGLIHIADWTKGHGQGYKLTDEGRRVLGDASDLAQLRTGKIVPRPAPEVRKAESAPARMTEWEHGETVRGAVYEPQRSVIARILILINVICFAGGIVLAVQNNVSIGLYLSGGMIESVLDADHRRSPEHRKELQRLQGVLHTLGGVWGPSIAAGEWWRLLSYAFVHGGFLHLAMNMFSLFALGRFAEKMWGPVRFLLLFLLSALGGGALALIYDPFPQLVGASGGTCGILAAFGVWVFLNRDHLPPETLVRWSQVLLVNAVLIGSMGFFINGVSNTGHLGGAALGAILGGLLSMHRFGSTLQRWLAALGVVIVPALCVGYLYYNLTHDDKWRHLRQEQPTRVSRQELLEHYLPKAQRAQEDADLFYRDTVFPLLRVDPRHRDPAVVQHTLGALRQARLQLVDAAIDLRQNAGPYANTLAEETRKSRAKHLQAKADVLDRLMLRLERGSAWTGVDLLELEAKRATAADLQVDWQKHLKVLKPGPSPMSPADSPVP